MTRAERLGLEPGSVFDNARDDDLPSQYEVAHSIAISLKRIADALVGDERKRTGIHLATIDISESLQRLDSTLAHWSTKS